MPQRISTKAFILLCFLILSIPLFIALQSLSDQGRESTLDLNFNSTSEWTSLRVDGANIIQANSLQSPLKMDYGSDNIIIREPGKFTIRAKIRAIQGLIKFYLAKAPLGQASVEIKGIGVLEDTYQPLKIPIGIKTNSSMSKVTFSGMSIVSANIDELKSRTTYPIITNNSIFIRNPYREDINLNLTTNISYQETFPTILLEKGNDGTLKVNVGDYAYYNNQTGNRTVRGLLVTIEMTSNKSQVFFDGGAIAHGKVLQLDGQDLQESIVGDNFIYLKYSHDGNAFRRARYLLDLNLSGNSKLTIYKNNSGFVNVMVGKDSYFVTDFGENLPYISRSFELKNITQEEHAAISVPVTIETTSDWTSVSFKGLESIGIGLAKVEGDIAPPLISAGTISLQKNNPENRSLVMLNLTLDADSQKDASVTIEKGDIGSTTVQVGDLITLNNDQKIKGNPSNTMTFALPELPAAESLIELYNPAASMVPIYAISNEMGSSPEQVQPQPTLSVSQDELPGWEITLEDSIAKGLIAYVFLSYLILIIFWLLELGKKGYFQSLWIEKISGSSIWNFAVDKFESAPVSSVIIFEALVSLALTPFLLIESEIFANGTAILAYLLLVAGVATRFFEMKNLLNIDKQKEMILKVESLGILLAAGYIGIFEMIKVQLISVPIGAAGILIPTGVFLLVVYHYLRTSYFESRKSDT